MMIINYISDILKPQKGADGYGGDRNDKRRASHKSD